MTLYKPLIIISVMLLLLTCGACAAAEPASPSIETPASETPTASPLTPQTSPPSPAATGEPAAQTTGAEDGEASANDNESPASSGRPESNEPAGQHTPPTETPTGAQQGETPPPSESPLTQPGQTGEPGAAPVPAEGPVILTIKGDGMEKETTWTLSQLQALREGYRELTYSTTNNWPSYGHMAAHGISLPYLLRHAGIKDDAASFRLLAADGYYANMTYSQIFGTYYTYTTHSPAGSSGATVIEPLIAWVWGDAGKAREENIRPFFGQSGPSDVNTSFFVKDLLEIEVSAAPRGNWPPPYASLADGSSAPPGTEVELFHDNMDSVRIYYTTDGSDPNHNSLVYNPSTSYFQPQLIGPITLTESVTIKAFASAYGRDPSVIVSFEYTVDE